MANGHIQVACLMLRQSQLCIYTNVRSVEFSCDGECKKATAMDSAMDSPCIAAFDNKSLGRLDTSNSIRSSGVKCCIVVVVFVSTGVVAVVLYGGGCVALPSE
ncbi:hypothetical protein DPMN_128241 [Dreissena polymorpha]|uniref:Transmembrane protein n=1 Tax=Dreissena polymorpha TaxID=45954 RepID=A0A9D4JW80_DREPO|nr:hypothetical protein DPMN_128241 [Dreissena polymorpha]